MFEFIERENRGNNIFGSSLHGCQTLPLHFSFSFLKTRIIDFFFFLAHVLQLFRLAQNNRNREIDCRYPLLPYDPHLNDKSAPVCPGRVVLIPPLLGAAAHQFRRDICIINMCYIRQRCQKPPTLINPSRSRNGKPFDTFLFCFFLRTSSARLRLFVFCFCFFNSGREQ